MQLSLMSCLMAMKPRCYFYGVDNVYLLILIFMCVDTVNMCESATHLGHFISSTNKESILKSAKSYFGIGLNICMSNFGQLSFCCKM